MPVVVAQQLVEQAQLQAELGWAGGRYAMDGWEAGQPRKYKTLCGLAMPPLCTRTTGPAEKIKGVVFFKFRNT